MAAIENEKVFGLKIRESANDGSDFGTPDADYRFAFLGEDGLWHVKDSAGAVTSPYGNSTTVATDTIWDAAGDVVVGTGANTAARLAVGASGKVLASNGTTLIWAYPGGYEFDFVTVSSTVSPTATTEATANTVVTANAVTYDGSTPILIEFFCPNAVAPQGINATMLFWLYDGSSSIGAIGGIGTPTAANTSSVVRTARSLTPSAAAHTYSIRASVSTGTGSLQAGAGGAGVYPPMFIRQTKRA